MNYLKYRYSWDKNNKNGKIINMETGEIVFECSFPDILIDECNKLNKLDLN